ncbi:MAG: SDR family oxidoreductase [Planctomycetota bacterium]|nr:SDR family oxidoreductase [Planctomycetota bacterium]
MQVTLKPLDQQVMVLTGASSGIGLATAHAAAERGAAVVLLARSAQAITSIAEDIRGAKGRALAVPCDVSDRVQVETAARAAINAFGRFDTWVNNAGVSIFGRIEEVSQEDARRLFDTNFWGVLNGCLAALPHLKRSGGALINVGSEVSEAALPLQGIYAASKHAVKGLTDTLRIEVCEVEEAPVAITLIQPTAVNTPYPVHARNYMAREPKLPTPQIGPERVAEAILDAAQKPTRYAKVGAMASINTAMAKVMPGLADRMAAKQVDRQQEPFPAMHRAGALHLPSDTTGSVGQVHGTPSPDDTRR